MSCCNKVGQAFSWLGNQAVSVTKGASQFAVQFGVPYYVLVVSHSLIETPFFPGAQILLPLAAAGLSWVGATRLIKSMQNEDSAINQRIEGISWFIRQGCKKPKREPSQKSAETELAAAFMKKQEDQTAALLEEQKAHRRLLTASWRDQNYTRESQDLAKKTIDKVNKPKRSPRLRLKGGATSSSSSTSFPRDVYNSLKEHPRKAHPGWLKEEIERLIRERKINQDEGKALKREFKISKFLAS